MLIWRLFLGTITTIILSIQLLYSSTTLPSTLLFTTTLSSFHGTLLTSSVAFTSITLTRMYAKQVLCQAIVFLGNFFEFADDKIIESFLAINHSFIADLCKQIECHESICRDRLSEVINCLDICLNRHISSVHLMLNSRIIQLVKEFEIGTFALRSIRYPEKESKIANILRIINFDF